MTVLCERIRCLFNSGTIPEFALRKRRKPSVTLTDLRFKNRTWYLPNIKKHCWTLDGHRTIWRLMERGTNNATRRDPNFLIAKLNLRRTVRIWMPWWIDHAEVQPAFRAQCVVRYTLPLVVDVVEEGSGCYGPLSTHDFDPHLTPRGAPGEAPHAGKERLSFAICLRV